MYPSARACFVRGLLSQESVAGVVTAAEDVWERKKKKKQPTHICCSAYHNVENKDIFWEEYSQPPHQHTHSGAFIIAACTSTTDPKVPD